MASGISGQRARACRRASGSSGQKSSTGLQETAAVWSRRGPGAGVDLLEVPADLGDSDKVQADSGSACLVSKPSSPSF